MKDVMVAGRALLLDLASTLLFVTLYALTHNLTLSVVLGVALALAQIVRRLVRRETIDALQWISLVLVAASGGTTIAIHDPIFVKLQPSAVYLLVGAAMLRKGWMARYMPARAMESVPDLVVVSGYVWAGLMFVSAVLNLALALHYDVIVWGTLMSAWGIGSKFALFFAQYGMMRFIGRRRYLARGSAPSRLQYSSS
jgi:intracellular septation protein